MARLGFGERFHRLAAFLRLRQQAGGPRAVAVGEISIVPNTLEAGRQSVHQKPPLELIDPERHGSGLLAVFAAVVLPLKRDLIVLE